MGTKRKSKGTVVRRNGRWYSVNTLPDGARHWTRIPDDGAPLSRDDAREFARQLQKRIDAGFDPRIKLAAPAPRAIGFYDYVVQFVERQSYESAARELRAVRRYLAHCPIAAVSVASLRPRHALALLEHLKALPSQRGGRLGASMVITTYNVAARALDGAPLDELLTDNPFRSKAVVAKLPAKVDKVPGQRATWRLGLDAIRALTTAAAVPSDRRTLYALVFFTGCRPGEFRALRFRDLDFDADPMPRLTLARAIKSDSGAEGDTKTGAHKEVPMLPPLVAILRAWQATGWAQAMGRAPGADDLVIPSVRGRHKGQPRNQSATNRTFRRDQTAVGLETTRHMYAARHTFVRMLRDAGASREVTRWATHAPPSSVLDNYAHAPPWPVLCAEFAKLAPTLGGLSVDASVDAAPNSAVESNGSTAESKRQTTPGIPRNPAGNELGADADSGGSLPLSLTPSTLSERARLTEGALWGWHDRYLAAEASDAN